MKFSIAFSFLVLSNVSLASSQGGPQARQTAAVKDAKKDSGNGGGTVNAAGFVLSESVGQAKPKKPMEAVNVPRSRLTRRM
jgi:hypothetical protein